MTLVTAATVIYWLNPPGNPGVDMACMIAIGFLIYGPVMLIGLHALELAPKKAAGTAAGFTGLFGYLGGSVAASAIVGYTVDYFGWDGGFIVMIAGAVMAVVLLLTMISEHRHKQKGHNGFARRPAYRPSFRITTDRVFSASPGRHPGHYCQSLPVQVRCLSDADGR